MNGYPSFKRVFLLVGYGFVMGAAPLKWAWAIALVVLLGVVIWALLKRRQGGKTCGPR